MKRRIATMLCLVSLFYGASAQQDSIMNAVVEVENEYNPTVVDAQKILSLPLQEEPAGGSSKQMNFARDVNEFNGYPNRMSVESSLPTQVKAPAGYARVGAGNYGLFEGRFYGNAKLTDNDDLKGAFSFDGWKGDMKTGDLPGSEWNSRFYRTAADAGYSHRFSSLVLSAGMDVENSVLNYKKSGNMPNYTDKQHGFSLGAGIGVASIPSSGAFSYSVNTKYKLCSQKSFLVDSLMRGRGLEHNWNSEASLAYDFKDRHSTLALDIKSDGLFYSGDALKNGVFDDYWSLQFLPSYSWNFGEGLLLHVGAHIDLLSANGENFQIAPDLLVEKEFSPLLTLFAKIEGGRELNTFGSLSSISPYWAEPIQLKPTYTRYDVSAGARVNPFEGCVVNLHAGYKQVDDNLFTMHSGELAEWPHGNYPNSFDYVYTIFHQDDAKVFYAGASLLYDYKDLLNVTLKGDFYHWDADDGKEVLGDAPVCDIDGGVRGKLFNGLYLYGGYRFTYFSKTASGRAVSVNDLSLKASYNLAGGWNVYIVADNLLNKKYEWFTGYVTPGTNVMAGLQFEF